MAPWEIVEDLGLPEHRKKLILVFGRSLPFFRSSMVSGPPRRRDQILPVEHPQPLIYLPYVADVLFLEVTGYDDRGQVASFVGSNSARALTGACQRFS